MNFFDFISAGTLVDVQANILCNSNSSSMYYNVKYSVNKRVLLIVDPHSRVCLDEQCVYGDGLALSLNME